MQLERASSNSGEARLAGWISTNHVTLFTMVLVVLIALLLNSNLLKKSKALDEKSAEATALLEDLEDRGLLDETLVVCVGEMGRTP